MISLTMRQHRPDDRPSDDQINVTVEPSERLQHWGVYVRVNDHYTAGEHGQEGALLLSIGSNETLRSRQGGAKP